MPYIHAWLDVVPLFLEIFISKGGRSTIPVSTKRIVGFLSDYLHNYLSLQYVFPLEAVYPFPSFIKDFLPSLQDRSKKDSSRYVTKAYSIVDGYPAMDTVDEVDSHVL